MIQGSVVDAATGHVVPGAAIWTRSDPGRRALSDASGVFNLSTPAHRSDVGVRVSAAGFVTANARIGAAQLHAASGPTVVLQPAAPFFGSVEDEAGRPVGGASIRTEPSGRGRLRAFPAGEPRRATSAPDGSFWIPDAPYGTSYRLIVEARGYPPTLHDLSPLRRDRVARPIRIVLPTGRRPWGTVVDTEGAPIADALVQLLWPPPDAGSSGRPLTVATAAAATSTAKGNFQFPSIAPGRYRITISHPEYAEPNETTASLPPGAGEVDLGVFVLPPGLTVRGVVVDPTDQPVAGAKVSSRQSSPDQSSRTRASITDENGRFRLTGLLPVATELIATADGFPPSTLESVRPATEESVLIKLTEGAGLAGRVLDPSGKGAAGTEVVLSPDMGNVSRLASVLPSEQMFPRVWADSDGRFRFADLASGRWSATARDDIGRTTVETLELTRGESREVELRLQNTHHLTIHVNNSFGEPVANAHLRVSPENPAWPPAFGRTDASGRGKLETGAGSARVDVSHLDLLPQTRQIVLQSASTELHMQLDSGWEITGTVRSVAGTPVLGATVEALPVHAAGNASESTTMARRLSRSVRLPKQGVSNEDGRFRLTGLDRGQYRLVARGPGLAEDASAETVLVDGRSVTGVAIVLAPEASVRGRVVGLDLPELAGAEVQAWRNGLLRSAPLDLQGNFELTGLAPGAWRIAATTGERRSAEQSVPLEAGSAPPMVELLFDQGFRLAGQVLVGSEPAAGGHVSVLRAGQEHPHRKTIDLNGRFEIEGLVTGAYELRFTHGLGLPVHRSLQLQGDHYGLLVHMQPRSQSGG